MLPPTKRAATAVVGFLLFTGSFASSFHTQSVAQHPPSVRNISRSGRSNTRPPLTSTSTSSNDGNDKADNNPAQDVPRGGGPLNGERIPALPTLTQYRKFALPCLALWVSGPLLSLVDTTFIGLSGPAGQSAQQLAALGPATTFFDGAQYLFAFLNVATTNLYSSARAQENGESSTKAESVVRTASRVSFKCGMGIMFFLFAFCRPLLSLYIGEKAAATPGLLDAAVGYVQIRALSLPTSLLLGVLQAALLGSKDSVTPLIAILYSTIVNVCGDYLLVSKLKWGLQGAAIATTAAQWASTAAMVGPARRKLVKDHVLGIFQSKRAVKEGDVTGKAFLSFAAPVLILIVGKLAAFGFMTNAAAGVPGQPTPLASHQIILSLLFFCGPFLEVISQTAQTFLPPFLAPASDYIAEQQAVNPSYDAEADPQVTEWLDASKHVATSLLGIGIVSATIVASIVSLIPAFFGNFITSDPTVQAALQPLAKYLWMGAFFWAPVAVAEGVLLARRELRFLAGVYLASTALLPPALLRIKFTQGNVAQVWACFAIFQLFRAVCFSSKIWVWPFLKSMLKGGNKGGKHQQAIATTPTAPESPESPVSPVSPMSPESPVSPSPA
jgi:Na+-driven multidrug efflux pump